MSNRALLAVRLVLLLCLALNAGGQESAGDPSRVFVSQISPDLAILTEVSNENPYVGQQFSILYRLRAQHAPSAVDIDPQQFPGFWTESVPISSPATAARPVREQGAVDYLLRQIIAFPLVEGRLQLPPLSLKIKRSGRISAPRDDWDLLGSSDPVTLHVVPLPPPGRPVRGFPLVGSAVGSLRLAAEGPSVLALEIEGTANLALFQSSEWLGGPPDGSWRSRLESLENFPQTIDKEGKRRLTLLQRQRWLISPSTGDSGRRLEGAYLPVFDPIGKVWNYQPVAVPALPLTDEVGRNGHEAAVSREAVEARYFRLSGLLAAVGLAGLAIGAAMVLWLRLRRKRVSRGTDRGLASLEKNSRSSPRAFLDAAHKMLEEFAGETGRAPDLGSRADLLDRCWISVQRFRFNREPLPAEAREEILESIKQLQHSHRG